MRRREFIALAIGAAAAPHAGLAQAPERVRRIGVLMTTTPDEPETKARLAAFLQGLQELGWTDGRNMQIVSRWGSFSSEELRKHAAELTGLAPDIILANGRLATGPLLQATGSVPIVFVYGPDPVGAGFVDTLARPGGNATGFTPFEYSTSGKWLEFLKEIAPNVRRVAVIRDPTITTGIGQFSAIQAVASPLRLEVTPVNVRDAADSKLWGQHSRSVSAGSRLRRSHSQG